MREIPLTQGKTALVDDEDYERLSLYKWYAQKDHNTYYAARYIRVDEKQSQTVVKMHQEILLFHVGEANGRPIDHKDHNGLNNQKENLRYCTTRENLENNRNNTSGYPGISFCQSSRKWLARAYVDGKHIHLGLFSTALEAHEQRVAFLNAYANNVPWEKPKLMSTNTSGFEGVYFSKRDQNWVAQATVNGKLKHLGSFPTPLEAHEHRVKFLATYQWNRTPSYVMMNTAEFAAEEDE